MIIPMVNNLIVMDRLIQLLARSKNGRLFVVNFGYFKFLLTVVINSVERFKNHSLPNSFLTKLNVFLTFAKQDDVLTEVAAIANPLT